MASLKRHEVVSANALQRSELPTAPAPAPKSPVRRLGQAVTFGVLLFVALSTVIAAVELPLGPFGLPLICSAWSVLAIYGVSMIGMDLLILAIERKTGQDINQDGIVGALPPVDNIVPVYAGPNVRIVDAPEPPPVEDGDRLIRLRPAERTIRKRVLWNYLLAAFMSADWTRDGCREKNINTKEWADVRKFVKRWPDVWETGDRPTLERYLRSLGWTGPNGPVPDALNERNGESEP